MQKSGAKPRQAKSAEALVFEAPPSMLGLTPHAPYTSTSPDLLSTLKRADQRTTPGNIEEGKIFRR